MSARSLKSTVIYFPPIADNNFLKNAADLLEGLRAESEFRGHPLLASLVAIAKGEAEDALTTNARTAQVVNRVKEEDDGVVEMAQRLACFGRR
jgi:hypothetical protein